MVRLLNIVLILYSSSLFAQYRGSIPVAISTNLFYFFGDEDEFIHLKITDTLTNQVWYDTLATVNVSDGFSDTVYLDSATYKCEVLDMGANVNMPSIILEEVSYAQWGYPDYEYYLFTLPVSGLGQIELDSLFNTNLYPNPTQGQINIQINGLNTEEFVVLELIDLLGKVIFKETGNTSNYTFDLSTYPKSLYLLKVKIGDELVVKKVMHQ